MNNNNITINEIKFIDTININLITVHIFIFFFCNEQTLRNNKIAKIYILYCNI